MLSKKSIKSKAEEKVDEEMEADKDEEEVENEEEDEDSTSESSLSDLGEADINMLKQIYCPKNVNGNF